MLDLELLSRLERERPRLIRAGLGDVLALFTGLHDWLASVRAGRAPSNLFAEAVVRDILTMLERVDARQPLRSWVEVYNLTQVLLCHVTDWVGSAPASGPEHLFAHALDDIAGSATLHGEVVALGTLILTHVQGEDPARVLRCMDALSLPRSLRDIGVSKEQVVLALAVGRLKGEAKGRHTVFERVPSNPAFFERTVDDLMDQGVLRP